MSGWIKLHRSLIDWEWYDDINATRLLIHLLISVNYEDKKWKGTIIKAGSMALSWDTLSKKSGLSIKQCRIAMEKLVESNEVTRDVTNKYQLVTLVKWEKLQSNEGEGAANKAGKGQTKGRQRATTKEDKEIKEIKEIIPPLTPPRGREDCFLKWLDYRKEINKPIKSQSSLKLLSKKFESNTVTKCEDVVNSSIENQWQGLFWDRTEKPKEKKKTGIQIAL